MHWFLKNDPNWVVWLVSATLEKPYITGSINMHLHLITSAAGPVYRSHSSWKSKVFGSWSSTCDQHWLNIQFLLTQYLAMIVVTLAQSTAFHVYELCTMPKLLLTICIVTVSSFQCTCMICSSYFVVDIKYLSPNFLEISRGWVSPCVLLTVGLKDIVRDL